MFNLNFQYLILIILNFILLVGEVHAQNIVGSDRHTSMLCNDGSVFAWTTFNVDGGLGIGTRDGANEAVRTMVENSIQIFCGDYSMVSVDKQGDVWAWGNTINNKFGMPAWDFQELRPKQIMHTTGVKKALVNSSNTIYLLHNGQVRVSGSNYYGQYGNGTTNPTIGIDSNSFLVSIDSAVDILCAISSAYAVCSDGTIYGWGHNFVNGIDSSSNESIATPKVILKTNGVISTSGSFGGYPDAYGSMKVVTVEGDVYVWGWNSQKQLGFENEERIVTPRKLQLPKKAKAVSGGAYHTIILYEDGTVATFGDNEKGQLGNPSVTNSATPVNVNGLTDIVAIGASAYTSFAFKSDGTLYGWGDNEHRQLNVDGASKYYQPRQIPLPCTPLSVAAQTQPIELGSTPNPVYDILRVALDPQTTEVEIYSMHGRIVHSEHIMFAQPQVMINMSSEPSGIYAVVRSVGNKRTTELVVKL